MRGAYGGQVAILFVARDRAHPGTYDATRGAVEVHGEPRPGDEDLLNFAAIHTLLHAGTVYVVKSGEVPEGGSLAAIYWLPLSRRRK
ncbi:MAG TPA: hypothetical protein VKA46_29025 [Gemmataceae bacterium]|nr:hypothetical protein [Gemmataceae bacterium]